MRLTLPDGRDIEVPHGDGIRITTTSNRRYIFDVVHITVPNFHTDALVQHGIDMVVLSYTNDVHAPPTHSPGHLETVRPTERKAASLTEPHLCFVYRDESRKDDNRPEGGKRRAYYLSSILELSIRGHMVYERIEPRLVSPGRE